MHRNWLPPGGRETCVGLEEPHDLLPLLPGMQVKATLRVLQSRRVHLHLVPRLPGSHRPLRPLEVPSRTEPAPTDHCRASPAGQLCSFQEDDAKEDAVKRGSVHSAGSMEPTGGSPTPYPSPPPGAPQGREAAHPPRRRSTSRRTSPPRSSAARTAARHASAGWGPLACPSAG